MTPPTLKANLLGDLRALLQSRLQQARYPVVGVSAAEIRAVEAAMDAEFLGDPANRRRMELRLGTKKLLHAYLSLRHRAIEPRPRSVERSRRLQSRILSAAVLQGLDRLQRRFEEGAPLGLYQSRTIDSPSFHDALLNHWDIHHLHLVARGSAVLTGDEILFLKVEPGRALFIDVGRHDQFADTELLESVDETWPEALGETLEWVKGVEGAPSTAKEIDASRRAGFNCPVQMLRSGRAVMPALGVVSTGLSIEVARRAGFLMDSVAEAERWLREHTKAIHEDLAAKSGRPPTRMRFRLVATATTLAVEHAGTGVRYPLGAALPSLEARASPLHSPSAWRGLSRGVES